MDTMVDAARSGDEAAFAELTEPYRHELQVHCYRMLASVEDAEDAVQETFLRAWTRLSTYASRAPFRAWLYGIATNVCLDALRRRKARVWPTDLVPAADPDGYPLAEVDLPWLQPYPDRLIDPAGSDPEAAVTARETIELTFLAAIQRLPARQRAVLVLRDVLDWSARTTAAALEISPAAVNSALQRAHATLAEQLPGGRAGSRATSSPKEKALLRQLITAWEKDDSAALIDLLHARAEIVMPPALTWFAGREAVGRFFAEHVFAVGASWRLLPTAANRQPAFAVYRRDPGEQVHRAFAIGLMRTADDLIVDLSLFVRPDLFRAFALPASL